MLQNMFGEVASENTLNAMKDLVESNKETVESIQALTEVFQTQLQMLVARTGSVDRLNYQIVTFNGNTQPTYTPMSVMGAGTFFGALSTSDLSGRCRIHEIWNNSDAGAARLYNNILISE